MTASSRSSQKQVASAPPFYSQDLQLQTVFSDGQDSIAAIVEASISHGRRIIGITDHAIGWDDGDEHRRFFEAADEFRSYLAEIEAERQRYRDQGITVLKGLEVEINLDGSMALAPGILAVIGEEANILQHVDYVIGVIHSESFAVSLAELGRILSDAEKATLLLTNIAALIANPRVLIWGHPFQAIHGHLRRHYHSREQQVIIDCLRQRTEPLLLEYNLNPTPRYYEWGGHSTHYLNGELTPNDLAFFERCITELHSRFVISTDAHDTGQTARLHAKAAVPASIRRQEIFLNSEGEPLWK